MSHHLDPRNTPELLDALRKHGLAADTPSQNADGFRLGFWSAQEAAKAREDALAEACRAAELAVFEEYNGGSDRFAPSEALAAYDARRAGAEMGIPISNEATDAELLQDCEPGRCMVSVEDEISGARKANCIHCGCERWRHHPHRANWGAWDGIGPEPGSNLLDEGGRA